MAEVTYLLGAGASANRLPIVKDMAENITAVIKSFNHIEIKGLAGETTINGINLNIAEIRQTILEDLEWMQIACAAHYSIDTFAKKLYLTNKVELERLKAILSFYFTYIQIKDIPDKRYDNFWASILTGSSKLPNKIKILSWNYDFQLEQSYINMSSSQSLSDAEQRINMFNLGMNNDYFDAKGFGIIKLNGSARACGSSGNNGFYLCDYRPQSSFIENFKSLVFHYGLIKTGSGIKSKLYFAWESSSREKLKDTASQFLKATKVLAVIGYSFPFFNREIDLNIFEMMEDLETIYIQDCNPEIIKERLTEIDAREFNYKLIKDVEQFVFPRELETRYISLSEI